VCLFDRGRGSSVAGGGGVMGDRWVDGGGAVPGCVVKSALLLREGDVIVAPDGSRHTVVDRCQLDFNCVSVWTDTGAHLLKSWFEAKADTYDVLVSGEPGPRCLR
jgi:hypothetical protein